MSDRFQRMLGGNKFFVGLVDLHPATRSTLGGTGLPCFTLAGPFPRHASNFSAKGVKDDRDTPAPLFQARLSSAHQYRGCPWSCTDYSSASSKPSCVTLGTTCARTASPRSHSDRTSSSRTV